MTTLVKFGNASPMAFAEDGSRYKNVDHDFPCITYISVPDEQNDHDPDIVLSDFQAHLYTAFLRRSADQYPVTNFPGSETLLEIVAPGIGAWDANSDKDPTWVDSDDKQLAALLGAWYNIPVGEPDDVEDTHWTNNGPPGVNYSPGPRALLVNTGNDIVSKSLGGAGIYTATGTATATSSTSLTNTGAAFSTSLAGQIVATPSAYAVIESATSTVLTLDRWYSYSNPGGSAASTPSGTTTYVVLPGCAPAMFIALSTTNSAPAAGDTTMAGEITTSGGGLIRAIATYAHTASATTYTISNTFTANGTDSLPATVYRMGAFISMVNGWANSMMLETTLNASATLTTSGDAVTVTDTVTI